MLSDQVVLAGGDEDLGAGDRIAAIGLRLGARLEQAQVGAAMRFGQAHGAGPAARDQRLEEHLLLPVFAVLLQRLDGAVREQREVAPGQVGGIDHFVEQARPPRCGMPWPPCSGASVRPVQPPSTNWSNACLKPGGVVTFAGVLVVRAADLVTDAVERCEHGLGEARGFVQHGIDQFAVGVAEAKPGKQRLGVEHVEQCETEVFERVRCSCSCVRP